MPFGIAQKNHIEIRARKSGAGLVSLIVSLLPATVTPETLLALPSVNAVAPSMSLMKDADGDWSLLLRFRSITAR